MAKENQQEPDKKQPKPNFNGAAIIDENGKETLITEEMIKDACDSIEDTKA